MEKVKSLALFFMLCGVVSPMNDEGSLLFCNNKSFDFGMMLVEKVSFFYCH